MAWENTQFGAGWGFPSRRWLQSIAPPGFKVHTLSVSEEKAATVAAEFGFDLPQVSRRPCPSIRARDRAIRTAFEIIEYCEPRSLNTASILEQSYISERTLQYAFLEFFGSSPAAVIKSFRLATARAKLRKATWGQKTVADIAHEVGFRHMPQFAADYHRAFGELPSLTLKHQF